ncbi:MAG TPA: hypothetical protein VMH78_01165 [Thermoplasmata archaeon]|nr:hypothetical protein [Thermoplasmata archaeon]
MATDARGPARSPPPAPGLWSALYALIWLVVLAFLLGLWPHPPIAVVYAHAFVGAVVALVAYGNYRALRATRAPARVKRVGRIAAQLAAAAAVVGVPLLVGGWGDWTILGVSAWSLLLFVHVSLALAVVTQSAAIAIAYDMWEEREFQRETTPGDVPPAESPVPSARTTATSPGG